MTGQVDVKHYDSVRLIIVYGFTVLQLIGISTFLRFPAMLLCVMFIPRSKIARWAAEIIQACTPDLEERIQRGALYRNLYLTGDENGNPATYAKTFAYIDNLASFLFSPLELRYLIRFHGGGNLTERAMGRASAAVLHDLMTDAGVYATLSDCVEWSLVKGKTFCKLNWEGDGFAPYMIQPEFLGVLRPDVTDLGRQEAFVHTTYYTPSEFASAFRELPNLGQLMRDITKRGSRGRPDQRPDRSNALKQIVLGGLNPFLQAGQSPSTATSRGIVNWLGGPQANWDAKVMAQLLRLDELWVKDSATDDWATFQMVGDVLVTGGEIIRNAFADMFDPDNQMRRLPDQFRKRNPLSGLHPFVEFCPNRLDGYFWGRSEICNVGVLQMQINARLNGIARLLRREEKPPKYFAGGMGITQQKFSAMDKPGGFFTDPTPNAKMQDVYPKVPEGLWQSLHEYDQMFDAMAGLPPVLQGRGESGVRAQGHAETLTRNASPRFKDRALSIERSVTEVGALGLALLRAMNNETVVTWLKPETQNVVAQMKPDDPTLEPPAPGMHQFPFRFSHIPDHAKVVVDSHSSSPAFSYEFRSLIFDMVKAGMMTPEEAVEHLHPAGEDDMVADIERREIQQAQLIKQHPELLASIMGGKKHR